ncbi:MAG: hypothetical protein COW00_08495 [Bdellovibrio sp. CG12_big_fil_rev_8_21_14_0_65_39_13]|nr:MAG: hypothetical protein COW78_08565 [Bdellovibrio sp. CG22_combo_CG10-13_8_21_14_all_39_27]PIQ59663.1 MAG: hypothetical protein COW00_08495 [Bdellovibrio sp. CG12_big_fil_rev_8_21_14_0_65_39_13]PIR36304.1 MAG: hypothetical protein COV37_04885 [Bdellovibrio sp. CG11_big_fil_rev_8_21_14_0_20_39_38]PJB52591.1 MAG: hypothetical protein CO099_11810 [Bdellovibrio sp. CG_4_9_14_3_um_filter_39_7]
MDQHFILTQQFRDQNGHATVQTWTLSGNGQRRLWQHPLKIELWTSAPLSTSVQTDWKSLEGKTMYKAEFETYAAFREARDQARAQGIDCFESDVRPNESWMMEQGLTTFINVDEKDKWKPCEQTRMPTFKVLSFDIETLKNGQVASIAFYFVDGDKIEKWVAIQGTALEDSPERVSLSDEKKLLIHFVQIIQKNDPDLIIGWNVIGFDLFFLEARCRHYGIDFRLGRSQEVSRFFQLGQRQFIRIEGRVVLDGPDTLRSHFFNFESFKLESVAQELLGTGKLITEADGDKWTEIERQYYQSPEDLCRYNLVDAQLVWDIFVKTDLLGLITERSRISGMTFERINSSTGAFDYAFLPELHRYKIKARDVLSSEEAEGHKGIMGGLVLDPVAGIYQSISVYDFRSLYPSLIRTFHIDPLARARAQEGDIVLPNEVKFSRTDHILPAVIGRLLERRAIAQKAGQKEMSQAIKILMNSFYGVLGSLGCRFYDPYVAGSITATGQWVLTQTKEFLEKNKNFPVIYGDTDSLFVQMSGESKDILKRSQDLATELNLFWKSKIENEFKTESYLEIKFEKNFSSFICPQMRSGGAGAKKRYAGFKLEESGSESLEIVGLEYVRSDWTDLAKTFQFQLLSRALKGEDVEKYIQFFVEKIEENPLESFIYKKRLSKPLDEYDKTQPPHVKAALKYREKNLPVPRTIEYVVTLQGPWAYDLKPPHLDYQHYIEKQLKPLADAILSLFGKKFDDCVSGGQLSLF